MELIKPDVGLLFWMLISFSIVLLILRRFAWKPILNALDERERGIEMALQNAQSAREEVADLKKNKEQIINEGNVERQKMIQEAQVYIDDWKKEQRKKTEDQIDQKIQEANERIDQQKRAAIKDLKTQVASLSIEIAQKILQREVNKDSEYTELINEDIKGLNIEQ
tara:strand:+ start:457 stop:954 length:498 start_codon:yes stop_codon:yes gene_type:complete